MMSNDLFKRIHFRFQFWVLVNIATLRFQRCTSFIVSWVIFPTQAVKRPAYRNQRYPPVATYHTPKRLTGVEMY